MSSLKRKFSDAKGNRPKHSLTDSRIQPYKLVKGSKDEMDTSGTVEKPTSQTDSQLISSTDPSAMETTAHSTLSQKESVVPTEANKEPTNQTEHISSSTNPTSVENQDSVMESTKANNKPTKNLTEEGISSSTDSSDSSDDEIEIVAPPNKTNLFSTKTEDNYIEEPTVANNARWKSLSKKFPWIVYKVKYTKYKLLDSVKLRETNIRKVMLTKIKSKLLQKIGSEVSSLSEGSELFVDLYNKKLNLTSLVENILRQVSILKVYLFICKQFNTLTIILLCRIKLNSTSKQLILIYQKEHPYTNSFSL